MRQISPPIYLVIAWGAFFLLPVSLCTQDPFLSHLDLGEPTSYDLLYFQDSQGFLWGVRDNHAIIRYDGHDFAVFAPDEADSTAFAGCPLYANWVEFLEDRSGKVWIRTKSGCLDRYDPQTGRFEHMNSVLRRQLSPKWGAGEYRDILADRLGNIWIASENLGVLRYDTETGTFEQVPQPGQLSLIFEAPDGQIWGCLDQGMGNRSLVQLDPQTDSLEKRLPLPTKGNRLVGIFRNRSDQAVRLGNTTSFLLDIDHQLYLFDGVTTTLSFIDLQLEKEEGVSNLYGNDQYVWIGTTKGRIYQYDPSSAGANSSTIRRKKDPHMPLRRPLDSSSWQMMAYCGSLMGEIPAA